MKRLSKRARLDIAKAEASRSAKLMRAVGALRDAESFEVARAVVANVATAEVDELLWTAVRLDEQSAARWHEEARACWVRVDRYLALRAELVAAGRLARVPREEASS